MSIEEYEEAMLQYEKKLSETIKQKIIFESKLNNLMKIKGKKKALLEEKQNLIQMIKKAQDDYLQEGKMDSRVYENVVRSYSLRLSEVESQLTFLDAEKALRNKGILRQIKEK